MAIHDDEVMEVSKGHVKGIDASAMSMVFDNLQKHQYQYPIKSTIRELVSNALDATHEKFTALDILTGHSTEEDHYLRRDEDMFKDSNFHKEYYSTKHLDNSKDRVSITHYYTNSMDGTNRDKLVIQDYGVGLGHIPHPDTGKSRLEGYFQLAYSSKRNTSGQLGKYGIGAKSALSTGSDFFTVTTVHNGRKYIFNVYSYKADSIVPKFKDDGRVNPTFTFGKGTDDEYIGYYLETDELNGTTIEVDTKKIHRSQFVDAVKSQLLYFNTVDFAIVDEEGNHSDVKFGAEILYEDDNLILANNTGYSKPHLILNGVNYGYVDFRELELADISGNIGLKVIPEEVDINPSRESLIWNDKTGRAVLAMLDRVTVTASTLIEEELQQRDFLDWLRAASSVLQHNDTIIGRLSRLVDKSKLKPRFPGNPKVLFTSNLLDPIRMTKMTMKNEYNSKKKAWEMKVDRIEVYSSGVLGTGAKIIVQEGTTSRAKDLYLTNTYQNVVKIRTHTNEDKLAKLNKEGRAQEADMLINYLLQNDVVEVYEDIEIPVEYENKQKEIEEEEDQLALTAADIRKLNKEVLIHEFRYTGSDIVNSKTVRVEDVAEDKRTIVYGFNEDKELLEIVKTLIYKSEEDGKDRNTVVARVAKDVEKYMGNHIHVKEYIRQYDRDSKTLGMGNEIIKSFTAYKIRENLSRMRFLNNYGKFNSHFNKLYTELNDYSDKHITSHAAFRLGSVDRFGDLLSYMNKIGEFQVFVDEHKDDAEAIAAESKSIFNFELNDAVGLDLPMFRKLQEVMEYIEPIHTMLNSIDGFERGHLMTPELEEEVRAYLKLKGVELDH